MSKADEPRHYDVQVLKDHHWLPQGICHDLSTARELALDLLENPRCEGARVTGTVRLSNGQMLDKEFFARTQFVRREATIHIDKVAEAPTRCERVEDYFTTKSRRLMTRLFKTYLEKLFLLPSEILHNFREMRNLMDRDALMPSAVARIATLQTPAGQDPKERRNEIFKAIDEISEKNRRADDMALPKITGSFTEMVNALPKVATEWERNHLALTALTRDLLDLKSYTAKLERLVTLMQDVEDTALGGLLDGLIAELLQTSVLKEILGYQAGLGAAIGTMLDLADGHMVDGCMVDGHREVTPLAHSLNGLFGEGRLPESQRILTERAHQQIASPTPLNRQDPTQEYGRFQAVLKRLLTTASNGVHATLHSGHTSAEALTVRALTLLKSNTGLKGNTGLTASAGSERAEAIKLIYQAMPDHAYGLIYLSHLSQTSFGHEASLAQIAQIATHASHLNDLVSPALSVKDRLVRATSAHAALRQSALPEAVKNHLTDFVERLVDEFMESEKFIEKLDNPQDNLKDRAIRLVQFCAAQILPEGRSLAHARNRIRELLRQPHFNDRFVAGIADPKTAQATLRDFHSLLDKAGFSKVAAPI